MIKQIELKQALELIDKGEKVPCLVPYANKADDFTDYMTAYLDEILDGLVCLAEVPDEPAIEKRPKKQGGTDRRHIDMGKVHALKDAGWSVKKIAEEMGVSQGMIYERLKEEREKEEEQNEVEN